MIVINIKNVEQLVFLNKKVRDLLPDFRHLFDQWRLSQMSPLLRSVGKRSLLDFLIGVNNQHILILNEFFNDDVTIDRLDYHTVMNMECSAEELEDKLNEIQPQYPYFSTSRKGNQVYISFWK